MANKIDECSTVTNTFFAAFEDKKKLRIAGIVKVIEDKQTPYAIAKRFKGDIALEGATVTYRAKYVFFPSDLLTALLAQVSKLGKWSSFEFVATATRDKTENADKTSKTNGWTIVFDIPPRIEKPRVLALLES